MPQIQNMGQPCASYGWFIDRDHICDGGANTTRGPRNIHSEIEQRLMAGEGQKFRMYDDDGQLHYEGRFIGDEGSEEAFGPLDDFGTAYSGCTRIDYLNKDGQWETL